MVRFPRSTVAAGIVASSTACLLGTAAAQSAKERCPGFKIIDGSTFDASKWNPGRPALIQNSFAWPDEYATHSHCTKVLGTITIKVMKNAGNKNLQTATSQGFGLDTVPMSVNDWVKSSQEADNPYVFNWCTGPCLRQLNHKVPIPMHVARTLKSGRAFISLGKGEGIPEHDHGHTWAVQLSGRKVWTLKDPSAGSKMTCQQNPGEALYVPRKWAHSTVNLEWQTSYGFQGQLFGYLKGREESYGEKRTPGSFREEAFPPDDLSIETVLGNMTALKAFKDDETLPYLHTLADTATLNGHVAVLKHLYAVAAAKVQKLPFIGELLKEASIHGHEGVVRFLLKKIDSGKALGKSAGRVKSQAALGLMASGSEPVLNLLLQSRADVCGTGKAVTQDKNQNSCLHKAAERGHVRMVEVLLGQRCDPQEQNKKKKRAMDFANMPYPAHEAIRSLLKAASDVAAVTV